MQKLTFSEEFDCVVVLNGQITDIEALVVLRLRGVPIIAADGAAVQITSFGFLPDLIVGDLDSITYKNKFLEDPNIEIHFKYDQNMYDFDKALILAQEKEYKNVLVLGMNGGELEHTLNNCSIWMKYSHKLNIVTLTDGRFGYVVTDNINIELKRDEIISIIPFPQAEIVSNGLKWALNGTTLALGGSEGARNKTNEKEISITLLSGCYLLFIDSRIPHCISPQV